MHCGGCQRNFTKVNFSQTQLKKSGIHRKCKWCQSLTVTINAVPWKDDLLTAWLRQNSGVVDSVYMSNTGCRGLSLFKRKMANTNILQIPTACIITLAIASQADHLLPFLQMQPPLPHHTLLAIFLLHERLLSDSVWRPYLDSLPISHSTPLFWGREDRKRLQGTTAETLLAANELEHFETYSRLTTATFTFGDFCWARTTVTSRIFKYYVNGQAVEGLVPLADMLNHSNTPNCNWFYDDASSCFLVQSAKIIPSQFELHDSYGGKCNSRFLVNYGFTLEDNAANNSSAIYLPGPTPPQFLDDGFSGCEFLAARGRGPCGADSRFQLSSLQSSSHTALHTRVFAQLRFLVATKDELQARYDKPISQRNETAVLQLLVDLCKRRSQELSPSMTVDAYREFRNSLGSRERNAATIVLGELEVLRDWTQLGQKLLQVPTF